MSTGETTSLGRITISPQAIRTIASQAALRSYGVVGMAPRTLMNGLADALAHDPRHGVEVAVEDGRIRISVYVVVEYGTRIASVAASVANNVRYQVERALGLPVAAVNVHVRGLRVSDSD